MDKTILVVEDDRSMRNGLRMTLELEGYKVMTATNGKQALEFIGLYKPDLIVADIKMPQMDGLTFMTKVRENKVWCDIPFVIVTAVVESDIEFDAKWRGAQAYMTKPFELEELLGTVNKILANYQV